MSYLYVLDMLGIAVFAVSGALAAGRKELDLIGVVVLAFVTAIGGGTLRDLLLDRHPIFWLADQWYVIVITGSALLTVAWSRWRAPPEPALLVADALGLALFSVVGAQIAERAGLPPLACIILGTITGCAGGVIRDVLSNELPMLLRQGFLYATCAIAGTATYFLLAWIGVAAAIATLVGMAVVAALRFASIWWRLQLPVFRLPPDR